MSGDVYDAPNQQAVRPDGSAPWEEGDGGSAPEGSTDPQAADAENGEPKKRGPGRPRKEAAD